MEFREWYEKLVKLAEEEDVLCLVSDSPEDHREGFQDGLTPDEELDLLISYADN